MNFVLFILFNFLIPHGKPQTPAGMYKCGNYFVDKDEVTNHEWMVFVNSINETDSTYVKYILPDSSNTWWQDPVHQFIPIVLITREQAMTYCQWKSILSSKRGFHKLEFKLPTPDEWSEVAQYILDNHRDMINGELRRNTKMITSKSYEKGFLFQMPFEPRFVEHLFDNVSELTSEPNIAMGGNNDKIIAPENAITQFVEYSEPNRFLGFRCIVEIQ